MVGTQVRAAAIDIGSNTVRLLIADVADASITDVERRVEIVGLGRDLAASGSLAPDRIREAVRVLAEYRAAVEEVRPDRIRVVATAATRRANNAGEFLLEAERALGSRVDVISGEDEAALSFAGAAWGGGATGPLLVIDPGGGSTEFVYGEARPEWAVSVAMGAMTLTDRLLPSRPPAPQDLVAALAAVEEAFAEVPVAPVARVIGVAGTFTSLAAIHLDLGVYDREAVHGSALTERDLEGLVARLSRLTVAETEAIPSLDPKRAPVILSGAVIAAAATRRTGGSVTVSEADLLEGVVLGLTGAR